MGCDVVVYFGNILIDVRNIFQVIFENNMFVNFNVLEVCKDFKIFKLVWVLSEMVLGYLFVLKEFSYFFVDEEYLMIVKLLYVMVKWLIEIFLDMYLKFIKI